MGQQQFERCPIGTEGSTQGRITLAGTQQGLPVRPCCQSSAHLLERSGVLLGMAVVGMAGIGVDSGK